MDQVITYVGTYATTENIVVAALALVVAVAFLVRRRRPAAVITGSRFPGEKKVRKIR